MLCWRAICFTCWAAWIAFIGGGWAGLPVICGWGCTVWVCGEGWEVTCVVGVVVLRCIDAIRRRSIWACCRRCWSCCCFSLCLICKQNGTWHLFSVQCLAWYRHNAISCLQIGHTPFVFFRHDLVCDTTRFIFWQLGSLQLASLHWHACTSDCIHRWIESLRDCCGSSCLSLLTVPSSRSNPNFSILWSCPFFS